MYSAVSVYGSYKEDVNITCPCSEKLTIQDLTRGSNRRAVGWMQGEKGKKMQLNQLGVSVRSVPDGHLEMRFGGGGGGGERERESWHCVHVSDLEAAKKKGQRLPGEQEILGWQRVLLKEDRKLWEGKGWDMSRRNETGRGPGRARQRICAGYGRAL